MPDLYTILVVEDDPGLASYLKRLLRPKNLSLITADSGRQAIQYLSQNTIDLVLLDIGLPDMDGYQVMDQICNKLPQAMVIVMTGDISVESAVEALRKGAYDYLRKPFESTELLNTVENALDRIRLEREHQTAERKLRESEEKYHQLFESESDAIVVVDAVTKRFEEVNRAAQLLYGYSREEFLALMLEDISAEQEKTHAKLESIRNGEIVDSRAYHRYFKKKDGTVFPGELSLATFASMGRQKIIGSVRDITERHQKEKELRQTKQRLQHIMASNPAVIYSSDLSGDGATTFISDNIKTELGYDPEDFINDRRFWIDHIHPDDVQYVKNELSRLKDQGSHLLEYRFRHKNGSYRWMRDELRLLLEKQSNAVEVVGSWTDITDIKQTEEALRKSEQQFRDLIENSPIGISIFQDNRFVYQNPEQMKINGSSPEKNIFQDLENIFPEDLDKVKTAHRRILKKEVSKIEVDFRLFRTVPKNVQADMRWVWCRAIAFNYYGKDAILINALDITKAKQLEQQLLIKNKMLSLGRVAAGIAHEIRNPLTGINTYLYTIEDLCDSDQLDPEDMEIIRQIVTQIQVASNKIETVIKRVMDFSKPGLPKMVRTDINESLGEAVKLSSVTMRKNGIKIEKSLAPDLPQCYADPQLIEQVVLNLITNAARAMEKSNGDKVVEIKSSAQNNTLRIQVADSGPGVPIELREKIFDPFFTTKDDGSGIGLNIAQRIVADHNGSITLDSSKWGGAEFKIELPIERRIENR
ncbi:MAG: PAS domain S-box protein [Desulfobacterales bacterium]|jgi:PAS domain S-box-containing protein